MDFNGAHGSAGNTGSLSEFRLRPPSFQAFGPHRVMD